MGLFSKIVNIFYDDVEPEETNEEAKLKKEVKEEKVVTSEKPRIEEVHFPKEEKKEDTSLYSERDIFKTETKAFKFPVIDEEDEKPRAKTRTSIHNYEEARPSKRDIKFDRYEAPRTSERSSEVRTFRPSPVISPVYGVLDKNYTKEEVVTRTESATKHEPGENYDSVRRKAYGTLEDELENTLTKISKHDEEITKTIEEVDNFSLEENNKSIEDLLNEIEVNKNMSIGEIEEKIKDKIEEEEESVTSFRRETENEMPSETLEKEEDSSAFDKTLEHDLFNLIDSMYEEKGEE